MGLYDPLIKLAGGGASMPIISFGNSLAKGAIAEAEEPASWGLNRNVRVDQYRDYLGHYLRFSHCFGDPAQRIKYERTAAISTTHTLALCPNL